MASATNPTNGQFPASESLLVAHEDHDDDANFDEDRCDADPKHVCGDRIAAAPKVVSVVDENCYGEERCHCFEKPRV